MRAHDVKPHSQNAPGDFYVEDNCCMHYRGSDPSVLSKITEIEDNHFMNPQQPTLGEFSRAILDLIWRR